MSIATNRTSGRDTAAYKRQHGVDMGMRCEGGVWSGWRAGRRWTNGSVRWLGRAAASWHYLAHAAVVRPRCALGIPLGKPPRRMHRLDEQSLTKLPRVLRDHMRQG